MIEYFVRAGKILVAEMLGDMDAAATNLDYNTSEKPFIYLPFIVDQLRELRLVEKMTYSEAIEQVMLRLQEKLAIIVLGSHYSNIALPFKDDLYRIYAGQDYAIPEKYVQREVALPADQLLAYEGVYDFGFGPIGRVGGR